ncbi:5571_t:CDS:1, partial [Scutellospora calospora]
SYTTATFDEMGDIPFSCPAHYNYTSPLIRTACQVRSANLVFMCVTGIMLAAPLIPDR